MVWRVKSKQLRAKGTACRTQNFHKNVVPLQTARPLVLESSWVSLWFVLPTNQRLPKKVGLLRLRPFQVCSGDNIESLPMMRQVSGDHCTSPSWGRYDEGTWRKHFRHALPTGNWLAMGSWQGTQGWWLWHMRLLPVENNERPRVKNMHTLTNQRFISINHHWHSHK